MKDEDGLELGPQPKPDDYRIWKGTVAEFFERAADTINKGGDTMEYKLFGKKVKIDRNLCHIRDETCSCQVCLEELEELKKDGDDTDLGYMECIKFV